MRGQSLVGRGGMDALSTARSGLAAARAERNALLADVLSHVRLSGAIFMRGEYGEPWAFETPEAEELRAMLAQGFERLIPFHAVTTGRAWVDAQGPQHALEDGDHAIV